MGNLHLVTGYAGRTHVTAADMGSLFEALIRSGQFVMAAGANFEATVVTNNSIRVKDGELLMQGRHVKLDPGAYVDLAIENGEQGLLRHDLIVARYTKNAENGVEECSLVVIKGTAVEGGPGDPEHTTGDINAAGDILHEFPLYRVPISGLNVGALEPLFTPQASLFDALLSRAGGKMTGDIDMAGHKVTGLGTPTAPGDAVPKSYAVPLDGNTPMSGKLTIDSGKDWEQIDMVDTARNLYRIRCGAFSNYVTMDFTVSEDSTDDNRAVLTMRRNIAEGKPFSNDFLMVRNVVDGALTSAVVFGGHNKPNGSYTGNNSATSRTIDVGGVGEVLTITSDNGTALVTNRGAICFDRSTAAVSALKSWEVNYSAGKITIATNNAYVNSNKTYYYQVL